MTPQLPLLERTDVRPTSGIVSGHEPAPPIAKHSSCGEHPELSAHELAFRLVATFRAHPHISNVLTHISLARWGEVERSLTSILDAATKIEDISPLAQNIIDLMCAERGITGRILKPYLHGILYRLLEHDHAGRMISHIDSLFLGLERRAQRSLTLTSLKPSEEANDD